MRANYRQILFPLLERGHTEVDKLQLRPSVILDTAMIPFHCYSSRQLILQALSICLNLPPAVKLTSVHSHPARNLAYLRGFCFRETK
jgi:hypothetical protein